MSKHEYSDDRLNMFVDNQLDETELNQIHEDALDDPELRERICKIKAVRELVGYAYESVPRSNYDRRNDIGIKLGYRAIAASMLVVLGLTAGWLVRGINAEEVSALPSIAAGPGNASEVFRFFSELAAVDHKERKIILHISTGDLRTVKSALDEAEVLLASYKQAGTPLKMDIIANKEGINLLRADVTPYADRIEGIIADNNNVAFIACERTIAKVNKREGNQIKLIPNTIINKAARDLIPQRLKEGWVYIKV